MRHDLYFSWLPLSVCVHPNLRDRETGEQREHRIIYAGIERCWQFLWKIGKWDSRALHRRDCDVGVLRVRKWCFGFVLDWSGDRGLAHRVQYTLGYVNLSQVSWLVHLGANIIFKAFSLLLWSLYLQQPLPTLRPTSRALGLGWG